MGLLQPLAQAAPVLVAVAEAPALAAARLAPAVAVPVPVAARLARAVVAQVPVAVAPVLIAADTVVIIKDLAGLPACR